MSAAIIYLRVSTKKQEQHNELPAQQKRWELGAAVRAYRCSKSSAHPVSLPGKRNVLPLAKENFAPDLQAIRLYCKYQSLLDRVAGQFQLYRARP
jgi:hypothetical protein